MFQKNTRKERDIPVWSMSCLFYTLVRKYLGFTLLPHSGVSLVLTGIAISSLTGCYAQYGNIVRGTIAAAAVINEVIAVFLAVRASNWRGNWGPQLLQRIRTWNTIERVPLPESGVSDEKMAGYA